MEVEEAKNCVKTFIETQFEKGRHKQRIEKI
ncbi:RpiB/LacA/LacB family sugar-phosphate isomerase [Alphaproteobacteria bacterium]|jgi:ribose 5-phosphate isomerase RpiB|nr:RpiB/LacA/LacB family sugar-phosphate isomerase [Alphaproteobacteria bacterium]